MKKLLFLLVFGAVSVQSAVVSLPELSAREAWTFEGEDLACRTEAGGLRLELKNLKPGTPVRMMLQKPLEVPSKSELDFLGLHSHVYELLLHPICVDAAGEEFYFLPAGIGTVAGGCFVGGEFVGNGLWKSGENLLRTEGMRDGTKETFLPAKPGRAPKFPLRLSGIQFSVKRPQTNAKAAVLHLRDFRFSDADFKNSVFYYQFRSRESFGEVDGMPSIALADFGVFYGERFSLDWELRTEYSASPVAAGHAELKNDPAQPLYLQLARTRAEIPAPPGTSWIRATFRSEDAKGRVKIVHREFRLYAMRGGKPIVAEKFDRIGSSKIRIAPERKTLCWEAEEPWRFGVRLFDAAGQPCRVEIADSNGKELLRKEIVPANADTFLPLEVPRLKDGICTVKVSVLKDGLAVDEAIRVLGKKSAPMQDGAFKLPAGVLTSREAKAAPPLFQLDFHVQPDATYTAQIRRGIDLLTPITRNFEIRCDWSRTEIFPGVFDFRELDGLMAHAQSKGASVQLAFNPVAPEWAPPHYTMNQEGKIFGHTSYLFHGARLNFYQSPVLRPGFLAFVRQAALRYRANGALNGYYLLIEHPGEASWKKWFEGFDPFTLGNFRAAMQEKYKTIDALNRAWKTKFKDFATVNPFRNGEKAAAQFWCDWIGFREESVASFKLDVVKTIRAVDPYRTIMLYGSGGEAFRPYDIMTANGGCRNPERFGFEKMKVAELDQGQRAEEVSCTNWYAFYPTHLDTSLFTMLLGGGQNTFCKMFFPIRSVPENGDLSGVRTKNGFERYEKMMPVWTALRNARPVFKDIRLYNEDVDGFRCERKSTFHPGGAVENMYTMLESHMPFWCAPYGDWMKAKVVIALPGRLRYLPEKRIAELAEYVKNGGTLIMGAETGRIRIEDEEEWTLLKIFGFEAPGEKLPGIPAPIFTPDGKEKVGLLRGFMPRARLTGGESVTAVDGKGKPAVTTRTFGRGQVYAFWAETNIPLRDRQGADITRLYLREIAALHGAELPMETNSPYIWLNLLRDGDTWFLLVMRNEPERDGKTPPSTIKLRLPAGNYAVTELINGAVSKTASSAELTEKGLEITLKEKEVAILQFKNGGK